MPDPVKRDLRAARIAATEEKILTAATELFLRNGYAATTLTAVAQSAQVGDRTVYLRFGTKAALLKRCVDVAYAGDGAAVDITGRDWYVRAGTAPTAEERIAALAGAGRQMAERAGDLLAVALQAAPTEPDLAAAARAGREATRANMRAFWDKMAADGLLAGGHDLDWLTDTTAVLVHTETYLLGREMMSWDADTYERWLTDTLTRLLTPTPPPHPTNAPH